MKRLACVLALAIAATGHADTAPAGEHPRSVIVLAAGGFSFSLGDARVVNRAPPSSEVRAGWRVHRTLRVTPEIGVIGYVYPEKVFALAAGARIKPLPEVTGARHLFVRAGVQVLAASGSDVAPGAEVGAAIEGGRLIAWVGLGVDRFVVHPRVLVQARLGVGVQF